MARRRIRIEQSVRQAAEEAAEVLKAGGVIVFPTETVYGVGVAAGNADALHKLRALKNRQAGKPFQFLAADMAMAERLGAFFTPKAKKLARNYWPGPLTLVVADGTGDADATLGIRIPDSPFVLALCRELDGAVISSSANPAGAPPPLDAEVADVFGDAIDLLIDGGPIPGGAPSTVVDCRSDDYLILREGSVDAEAVKSAWEE